MFYSWVIVKCGEVKRGGLMCLQKIKTLLGLQNFFFCDKNSPFVISQGSLKLSITKIIDIMILIRGQGILTRMTKMMVL